MSKIDISKISTLPPKELDKDDIEEKTYELLDELRELQNVMYAQEKYSLLIVMQGLDASGKDGAIKKVFSGINPMGCRVQSFKKPSEEEMSHEFLWRIHKHVPEKGMIQIFNRSHYEDVLIQRVHAWVDFKTIERRFAHINAFERLIAENDTRILKFYMHISQKEQIDRLNERMKDPKKMWKYNPNDLEESKRWDEYMVAYNDVFNLCSPNIPWNIVPSDKNWYKEYLIAQTLVQELKGLKMKYPELKT